MALLEPIAKADGHLHYFVIELLTRRDELPGADTMKGHVEVETQPLQTQTSLTKAIPADRVFWTGPLPRMQ